MSALGWFRAGGVALIVVGAMHLSAHFSRPPSDLAFRALQAGMEAYHVTLFGVDTSFHAISEDLSVSFSVFSFLCGAVALVASTGPGVRLRPLASTYALGVGALVAVAIHFRVAPPAVTDAVALLCFGLAALRA
jgi:hypothetical protein